MLALTIFYFNYSNISISLKCIAYVLSGVQYWAHESANGLGVQYFLAPGTGNPCYTAERKTGGINKMHTQELVPAFLICYCEVQKSLGLHPY